MKRSARRYTNALRVAPRHALDLLTGKIQVDPYLDPSPKSSGNVRIRIFGSQQDNARGVVADVGCLP
jgi:hypothetical protein